MPTSALRLLAILLLFVGTVVNGQSFVNFETAAVRPISMSADGQRLFVTNTPRNRLEIYSLEVPDLPVLIDSIPVGLEPIAVRPRTADEVWVVNNLSDSVSIVSLSLGRVVATLHVMDEPADVVFAGNPERAFVSVSASDEVQVFDAATRAPVAVVPIFGKDPRTMAVDPNGNSVYVVVHRSGNRTTLIPEHLAPPPPMPTNPALPPAPQQGIIFSLDNPLFAGAVPFDLPDYDVFEIDVATLAVARQFTGIGTINFGIAVAPGELFVANINSLNDVAFEPNLRGHAIDSRITRVTTGVAPVVTAFDLNPGIDYNTLPNPAARATALAEPTDVVFDPAANELFVAAQGTDRVGVVSVGGVVLERIEIGSTPGATVDTLAKRGPRALSLHPTLPRLYVFNRLSHSLSIVDTSARVEIDEISLGYDPTPSNIRDGRKFLYDAKLSGNGTMSCASCHIDGDVDLLSWDLGDPGGSEEPIPSQPFPFNIGLPTDFHPMKGPMLTQTLRGLAGGDPLHWRGDRADPSAFNGAFDTLLGGSQLSSGDLALFADFLQSAVFPPNPNQNLDRSLPSSPPMANALQGESDFELMVDSGLGFSFSCATCHAQPDGGDPLIVSGMIIQVPQPMNVPQLRNLYRRQGTFRGPGDSKSGFGFLHDGAVDTLDAFMNLTVFNPWPVDTKDDISAFLATFDTGMAPTVGYQVTVDSTNVSAPSVTSDLDLLEARAAAGDCDLVVQGVVFDQRHGFLYDPMADLYLTDDPLLASQTRAGLLAALSSPIDGITFTGVPPGSGTRIGLDEDLDGQPNAIDGLNVYGVGFDGSAGRLYLTGNREPAVSTHDFAFVCHNLIPGASGGLAFSVEALITTSPVGPLYINIHHPSFAVVPWVADSLGTAILPVDIPNVPMLAGFAVFMQTFFSDPGGPFSVAGSNGLLLVFQP